MPSKITNKFRIVYREVDPHAVTTRIIRNPNYGGAPCSVPGCCLIPYQMRAMKPKFFEALAESVKREGFRNPIVLVYTDGGYHLQFGGSRLRTAKQLDIPIPALVVDWTCELPGKEVNIFNWDSFFTDVPDHFEVTPDGLDTHYSLERNRRDTYDPKGFSWVDDFESDFIREEFPWVNYE